MTTQTNFDANANFGLPGTTDTLAGAAGGELGQEFSSDIIAQLQQIQQIMA